MQSKASDAGALSDARPGTRFLDRLPRRFCRDPVYITTAEHYVEAVKTTGSTTALMHFVDAVAEPGGTDASRVHRYVAGVSASLDQFSSASMWGKLARTPASVSGTRT